jgi:hypothetical protein
VMTDGPGGLWIGQQKVTAQNAQTHKRLVSDLRLDVRQQQAAG